MSVSPQPLPERHRSPGAGSNHLMRTLVADVSNLLSVNVHLLLDNDPRQADAATLRAALNDLSAMVDSRSGSPSGFDDPFENADGTPDARPAGVGGLPEEAILMLPLSTLPAHCAAVECCVCVSAIEPGSEDRCVRLPCAHLFHAECIQRWLRTRRSCPLCRTLVEAEAAEDPAESLLTHVDSIIR